MGVVPGCAPTGVAAAPAAPGIGGFALILVLFILLVIIGSAYVAAY
ncbi:YjcZ family sporulation protein [Bacillus alkalicellulosilyticus]|nr:YjcZ family sporulation protein [Bacillus alkalicellulosilyticus]